MIKKVIYTINSMCQDNNLLLNMLFFIISYHGFLDIFVMASLEKRLSFFIFSQIRYKLTKHNERGRTYCIFHAVSCCLMWLFTALCCMLLMLRSSWFLVCLRIYSSQTVSICFLIKSSIP